MLTEADLVATVEELEARVRDLNATLAGLNAQITQAKSVLGQWTQQLSSRRVEVRAEFQQMDQQRQEDLDRIRGEYEVKAAQFEARLRAKRDRG